MAAGARVKQIQQQSVPRLPLISVPPRQCLWTCFLVIFLIGFLISHELLYSNLRLSILVGGPVTNDTLRLYSTINSEGLTERNKIRYLLKTSHFGKVSIKDVVYSDVSLHRPETGLPRVRRRPKRENVWMLPLTSGKFQPYLPKFYELAKKWLGDGDFDPEVMQDLVEKVKGPLDRHSAYFSNGGLSGDSFSKQSVKYQSCAVVGNSGILLNSSYGEQIDSHEMVIRLNNAEIFQYRKYVGSKTTISFMNSNVFRTCTRDPDCWCHPYGSEVPIILYICQAPHLMDVAMCRSKQRTPLLTTDSLFDTLCSRIVKWYSLKNFIKVTGREIGEWESVHRSLYFHYSSGMQAIMLALGICDSVDIFGFGKSAGAKHHYHTQQLKELALHDYAAEYIFYDDLIHNRTIPFLSEAGISIPPVRIFY